MVFTRKNNTGRVSSQTINGQTTHYDYDGAGRLTKQWGPATYPVRYNYDTAGRLRTLHTYGRTAGEARDGSFGSGAAWPEDAGEGHVTTWNYVAGSRLLREKVDAAGKKVSYAYNALGLPATRTWARGVATTYGYWQTGDLASINYSDGTPGVLQYYNAQGRLSKTIDAAGTHDFTYQPSGALWSESVTGGVYNSGLAFGYDSAGRLSSVQGQMGAASLKHTFGYDAASGRMDSVTGYLEGASVGKSIAATYGDRAGTDQIETTTLTANAYGQVSEVLKHTRTYSGPDRLVSVTASRGGTTVEGYTWGYDGWGRRKTATVSGGERNGDWWDYSYNDRGEVTGGVRKDAAGNVLPGYEFGYSFDALGNRIESWREGDGARSAYTANALNQYENRTVPGEARVSAQVQPGTAKVRLSVAGQSALAAPGSDGLVSARVPIDNAAAAQFPEVTIEAVQPGGTGGTDWRQMQSGRVFVARTPEVITHDLDGNQTSDGRWTYEWDAENRLVATETQPAAVAAGVDRHRCEFAYDGRHRRIRKVVKTGWDGEDYTEQAERRFLYDEGWNLLAEVDGSGASIATYLWGLDLSGTRHGAGGVGGLLAERIDGKTYLPCYDGNGNIVRLVAADGNDEDTVYEYGPFGEALRATGWMAKSNPFRWSTRYTDEETGLVMYPLRPYSPATGRWLSRDRAGEEGGENLYGFVDNDPIGYIDALGLWKAKPGNKGKDLAEYEAEKGDTIAGLAGIRGLKASEYKKWLTGKMPASENEEVCGDYKVPNTVIAYWAGAGGFLGRLYTGWRGGVGRLKSQGYKVEEHHFKMPKRKKVPVRRPDGTLVGYDWMNVGGSPRWDLQTKLNAAGQARRLHGLYFWGHGDSAGLTADAGNYFGPQTDMVEYETVSVGYGLGLLWVYACESCHAQGSLGSGSSNMDVRGSATGMLIPLPFGFYIDRGH